MSASTSAGSACSTRTDEAEPLLIDWRAPAARAFYVATGASPENMRRRRQFHTRGRRVLDFTDEILGRPDEDARGGRGDVALLAAVNAPRGDGMRDIVATIQAEQDEIIRLEHAGVLVIEGGPGTGKTVVALHRVAYLLYTQRRRMESHGVLVVGPNAAFLDHVGRVLPSLGRPMWCFMTTGDLVPGMHVTGRDTPEVTRRKGALSMLDVLAAAVADRQRVPDEPVPIQLADVSVRIDAETAQWAVEEARASGKPHNDARTVFVDVVTWVLTERAIAKIGRGWLTRDDRTAWEHLRAELVDELDDHQGFAAALDELWPTLTPQTLLAELYSSPDRLRAAGARPRAVAGRRRRLDGLGCAAARRTGRPVGPGHSRRAGRRTGAAGGGRLRGRRAGPDDRSRGPDGRRGPAAGLRRHRRRGAG